MTRVSTGVGSNWFLLFVASVLSLPGSTFGKIIVGDSEPWVAIGFAHKEEHQVGGSLPGIDVDNSVVQDDGEPSGDLAFLSSSSGLLQGKREPADAPAISPSDQAYIREFVARLGASPLG